MSRTTDAIIQSIDPEWEQVGCGNCGRAVRWPAKIASFVPERIRVRPLCSRCDGSKDILKSAEDILRDIPGLIERAMAPDGVDDHRLDGVVYDFLSNDQSTLLLTGPTLSGKTAQCVNLIRRWCRKKRLPALYRTEVRMLSELRSFGPNGTAAQEMHRLCSAPLLIIDDVGTAHTATEGWALEQYMRIVDERYRHLKTVITSNLEIQELMALPYIDDRVQRRLKGNLHRCARRNA